MSLQKGWHAVRYSLTARKTIYTFQRWEYWLWLAAVMLPNRISEEFMYSQYPEWRFTYQANLCYNITEVVKSNSTSVLVQLDVITLCKCAGGSLSVRGNTLLVHTVLDLDSEWMGHL